MGEQRLQSSRLALHLSPADLEEFRGRLHGLLDEYARRAPAADGERWLLYFGMHRED